MKINMEGFWRRLGFYMIGFVISSIFVYMLFGNRSCNWMPGDRIKLTIFRKVLIVPESQEKELNALGINRSNLELYLKKGTIDFSESLKNQGVYPKAYIYKVNDTVSKRIQVSLYEDSYIAVIHVLEDTDKAERFYELEGFGDVYWMPKDSSFVFIDNTEFLKCKSSGLATNDYQKIIRDIKTTGKIDFSESDLMLPKSELRLHFTQNDTLEVRAKTIQYRDRITFQDFIWDYKLPCE